MNINLSACRFDAKEAAKATLWYYDAFNNTGNKPFKFIKWCYDLTVRAIRCAKDGEERTKHQRNLAYLEVYVKMGE